MLNQYDLYSAIKTWLETKATAQGNKLKNVVYTPIPFDIDFSFVPRQEYTAAIKPAGYSTDMGKQARFPNYLFDVGIYVKFDEGNYQERLKELTNRVDYFVNAAKDSDYLSVGVHLSLITAVGSAETVMAGEEYEDMYAYQVLRFELHYAEVT